MNYYKCLKIQKFSFENYKIVPIRIEDRWEIMKWRNEQLFHLRQEKALTKEDQDNYFSNIVIKLFEKDKPEQLLFSMLENDTLVGYGGLVHIDWHSQNAEISFVMNTSFQHDHFTNYWTTFLKLIETLAFNQLGFQKIYTYAFDLRPHLYPILLNSGYLEEARLQFHKKVNGIFKDVLIHSKLNKTQNILVSETRLRHATIDDSELLFLWANDEKVRQNAKNTTLILLEDHIQWFNKKINNKDSAIFILERKNKPIGQIRVDFIDSAWVIDYSLDRLYRGLGFGSHIVGELLKLNKYFPILAFVKKENIASANVFHKMGFKLTTKNETYLEFSRFA